MRIKGFCVALILLLISAGVAHSQENRAEICVDFRVNSKTIDSSYGDNAARMEEMISFLKAIRRDSTISILEVSFSGAASPEGNSEVNRRLSRARLSSLEKVVRQEVEIPDSVITRDDDYIPWDYLRSLIAGSDLSHKQEVLEILDKEVSIPSLKAIDNGRVWQEMLRRYFSKMRNACAIVVTYKKEVPPEPVVPEPEPEPEPEPVPVVIPEPEPVVMPEPEEWTRHIYLKTNAVGWGMLISNLAVEVDLAKHWSFTVPVYYSALNYFTSDVKFRTMCLQPEVRYWLREDNAGWFAGAHFGLAWFNYAKGGDWRYQDHNRRTPLWGGGLSGGYRMPISENRRWWMEFTLGAGMCKLHYDIFHNEPNGQLVDTRKRTFYGIDQVAVSFAYRFDWNELMKKGGKR